MTLKITSAGSPRRGNTKQVLGAAAAAAVALATLAGIATWQARTAGEAGKAESGIASGATSATVESEATARGGIAPTLDAHTRGGSTAMPSIVYVAGSHEQADALRAAIAEADVYRMWLGEAVPRTQVLLFATADDEAVLQMLVEQDAIRGELGLPATRIVDLRTLPAAPDRGATACADGAAGDPMVVRFTCP